MSSEKHMERARELAKDLSDGLCGCNDCLTTVAAALAKVEAETREACAAHLERQPSFGDGKWAARIVRELTALATTRTEKDG